VRQAPLDITCVGDIMLGRFRADGYDAIAEQGENVFSEVWPLLKSDLLLGNLETPLTAAVPDIKHDGPGFRFAASKQQAQVLQGFHALSLANNHALDLGTAGLKTTPEILYGLGIAPLGAAQDLKTPPEFELLQAKGYRVGVLAITTRLNAARIPKKLSPRLLSRHRLGETLAPIIRRARTNFDVLMVVVHWGQEYADAPSVDQVNTAHQLIDEGVDFVIGHHPHVLQAIEHYKQGLIAYSLGNFVFDNAGTIPRMTGVLRVRIHTSVREAWFHPAYIERRPVHHPALPPPAEATRVLQRVSTLSSQLNTNWQQVEWKQPATSALHLSF